MIDSSGKVGSANTTITVGNTAPTVDGHHAGRGRDVRVRRQHPVHGHGHRPGGRRDQLRATSTVTFVLGHDTHGHAEASTTGCSGVLPTDAGGRLARRQRVRRDQRVVHRPRRRRRRPALTTVDQNQIRQKRQEVENVAQPVAARTWPPRPTSAAGCQRGSLSAGDWIELNGPFNLLNINSLTFRVDRRHERRAVRNGRALARRDQRRRRRHARVEPDDHRHGGRRRTRARRSRSRTRAARTGCSSCSRTRTRTASTGSSSSARGSVRLGQTTRGAAHCAAPLIIAPERAEGGFQRWRRSSIISRRKFLGAAAGAAGAAAALSWPASRAIGGNDPPGCRRRTSARSCSRSATASRPRLTRPASRTGSRRCWRLWRRRATRRSSSPATTRAPRSSAARSRRRRSGRSWTRTAWTRRATTAPSRAR